MPLPDGRPARIMVVGAHPVDVFDSTGGTCAEHIAQGDHVIAVICTSGIHTHNERLLDELRKPESDRDPEIMDEPPETYAARKRDEAYSSLGCFGITDVEVLPYDDGKYELDPAMINDLTDLILDRKPHVIIQQNPMQRGAIRDDHALIGVAAQQAICAAAQARYGDPRPSWTPVDVYLLGEFGVKHGPFGSHMRVDVFVDVTKHVEAKARAHQFIATQGQNVGWGQKRVEAVEGHAGIFSRTSYAECFARIEPPVCDTLPINRKRYEDLKLSSAERFKKNHQLTGAFVREADGSYAGGFKPE